MIALHCTALTFSRLSMPDMLILSELSYGMLVHEMEMFGTGYTGSRNFASAMLNNERESKCLLPHVGYFTSALLACLY